MMMVCRGELVLDRAEDDEDEGGIINRRLDILQTNLEEGGTWRNIRCRNPSVPAAFEACTCELVAPPASFMERTLGAHVPSCSTLVASGL
jgi:hypothetical protein